MNRKTHFCVFNMLMAFSSCLQLEPFSKVDSYSYSSRVMLRIIPRYNVTMKQQLPSALAFKQVKVRSLIPRKGSAIRASLVSSSEIAGSAFTWGTVAVLPFYTLMIVAPKAKLTKKCMESSMPYMVLGLVYAYLLHLSWSPNTIQAMFATKYLLPELPGIAKLFSNEMTLASAWIHLLAIDLFAARQIFDDGRQNGIETRHSISLCLLSCPLGILSHFITKALTKSSAHNEHDDDM